MLSIRLCKLRYEQGWSQEALAEKLNTSRQTISKWESGKSLPSIDNLILIRNVFNVSYEELLDE